MHALIAAQDSRLEAIVGLTELGRDDEENEKVIWR
jgi:hypothetical protein